MPDRPERPGFVTWLAVAVLLLSAANLGGAAAGLARQDVLITLDLSVPLWALIVWHGTWGLIWLIIGSGLWALHPLARRVMLILLPVYQALVIGMSAVFVRGDYERGRLPFAVFAALLISGLVIVGLTRAGIRQAFGESPNYARNTN